MGSPPPTYFPLAPELSRWWEHECLPKLEGRLDLAIPVALLRGLRWWILPGLPRAATPVAQDANARAWNQRIARQGLVTTRRHAAPRYAETLAATAADFLHEVTPGGACCVTLRPARGRPGPPVCVCGLIALTWPTGGPVEPDLNQLALDLVDPLAQAVRQKLARRFTREAQPDPDAPVTVNAVATLDAIVQALLWLYVELMKDWADRPRDPLAVRVARRAAVPMRLPDKRGHRSRIAGEEYEWWLAVLHDRVRQVMRPAFRGQQWATTGRTPEKQARFAQLRKTWPILPVAVLKAVSQEDVRAEAEHRLTAAVAETLAGVRASSERVRRAQLRHRTLIQRFDAADRAGDLE